MMMSFDLNDALGRKPEPQPQVSEDVQARIVLDYYSEFSVAKVFARGQVVRAMKGSPYFPDQSKLAVVVEMLESPVFDDDATNGNPHFLAPLDMAVGHVEDGTYSLAYVMSCYFEPYDGAIA